MLPSDLIAHAEGLLLSQSGDAAEVDRRRAVSAAYYALFHALTGSGADLLATSAQGALHNQVRCSFNHGPMRQVCSIYIAARRKGFPPPYDVLTAGPPSDDLFAVAEAFIALYSARQLADYDLLSAVSQADAENRVALALQALTRWDAIKDTSEAHTFLTALLLADRWTRRG